VVGGVGCKLVGAAYVVVGSWWELTGVPCDWGGGGVVGSTGSKLKLTGVQWVFGIQPCLSSSLMEAQSQWASRSTWSRWTTIMPPLRIARYSSASESTPNKKFVGPLSPHPQWFPVQMVKCLRERGGHPTPVFLQCVYKCPADMINVGSGYPLQKGHPQFYILQGPTHFTKEDSS